MPWSETSLHRWLLARLDPGALLAGSRGHDAAVLAATAGRTVACVDQTIEGVHFEPGTPGRRAGRKAASRALSDLAATAARPRAVLLGLRAPASTTEAWIRAAILGVDAAARDAGARLVAGDLAQAPGPLALTVSALGLLEGRRRAPGRDRARPGDVVLVTGPVGGSRIGRHLRFRPRVAEGRWLHAHGAHALMDVSDGLALDLSRLAERSRVRIDLERVPVHPDARRAARASGRTPRDHALADGEDHELLATLPRAAWERVRAAARRRIPALEPIGRVRPGAGLWIVPEEGGEPRPWSGEGGWRHGG